MNSTEAIQKVIGRNYKKIGWVEFYETPTTVKNNFIFTEIKNCICHIEVLGLGSGSGGIYNELKYYGLNVERIGLDLYVTK